MDAVERILEHWKMQGVPLNPGASPRQLAALEAFLGCRLSDDVRRFYSVANGMQDFAHDSKIVSFWSVERILREKDVAQAGDEFQAAAFADVIIYSWTFRYRLRADGPLTVVADGSRSPPVPTWRETVSSGNVSAHGRRMDPRPCPRHPQSQFMKLYPMVIAVSRRSGPVALR
jgi:hypothetical protein